MSMPFVPRPERCSWWRHLPWSGQWVRHWGRRSCAACGLVKR